jgi:hypothetical protein
MTCERCGADALGADGVCQVCGWQTEEAALGSYDSSPSLGETRAADIPAPARPAASVRGTPPVTAFAPQRGTAGTSARAFERPGSTLSGSTNAGRFCGSCGARIELGQQFCGQCGAAVGSFGVSNPGYGTELRRAPIPSGPAGLSDDVWPTAEYDAPTEAFSGVLPGVAPGYRSASARAYGARSGGMSRELRIVLGILCILGGLVSGAGAIILALAPH